MDNEQQMPTIRDLWKLILAVLGLIAVIQELRKPKDLRTWNGRVADFVPYDFRIPTVERIRNSYWNPDGPVLPGKPFGVGWTLNLGAILKQVGVGVDGKKSTSA